jgi:hypothetical protein
MQSHKSIDFNCMACDGYPRCLENIMELPRCLENIMQLQRENMKVKQNLGLQAISLGILSVKRI